MRCRPLYLAIVIAGCGRLGFEGTRTDDAIGPADDAPAVPGARSIEMPAGGQFFSLARAPNGDRYALARRGLFRSGDDGLSWMPCGLATGNRVDVTSDNRVLLAGGDVLQSTNGCLGWVSTMTPRFTDRIETVDAIAFGLADDGLYTRNQSNWGRVPTPLDGQVFRSFATRTTDNVWVAGTAAAGLIVSTNGGAGCTTVTMLPSQNVDELAVGPTRGYALAAATAARTSGAVACSTGALGTWTECVDSGGTAIAIDPGDEDRVLVALYDDLAQTTNGFATLDRGELDGMDEARIADIAIDLDGTAWVASDRGVFRAADRSLAWQPRMTGLDAWSIASVLVDGDDVFLATPGGPLRSVSGAPFEVSTSGIAVATSIDTVAKAPDGTLFAAGRMLSKSTDGGATWTTALGLTGADEFFAHTIAFDGMRAFIGTPNRVLFADPPWTTWTPVAVGNGNRAVRAIHPDGLIYAATSTGLYVSSNGGTSFTALAGPTSACRAIVTLPDNGLAAGCGGDVWTTDPARTTWTANIVGSTVAALHVIDGRVVASTDKGVFWSDSRGASWQRIDETQNHATRGVYADPADGTLVYATTTVGLVRVPRPW